MTHKENITAILECYFTGFKKEIIDSACNRILEQEPCEDAISREMALKECHDIVVDGERYSVIQEETLLGLPSVNPTKTGHWIDGWVNKYKTCPKVTCSECGIDGTLSYKEYKYCPNCGARMIEQEESEE